jgi:hypothetical protein
VRVLFDWTLDLAFPRDIVVTAPPPHSPSLSGAQKVRRHDGVLLIALTIPLLVSG